MKFVLKYTVILFCILSFNSMAQDTIIVKSTGKKNIIRYNLTPNMVVGPNCFVIGYERVLKDYRSISFNIGYLELRDINISVGNKIRLFDESSKGGFDLMLDYRYYLKKRNTSKAPDGLYIAPYFSYYWFWFKGETGFFENSILTNTVYFDANLHIGNLGLQLGYQFVFLDRFTVDLLLLGPSLSFYNVNFGFKAQAKLDPDSEYYTEFKKIVDEYFPYASGIIGEQRYNKSGRMDLFSFGFRYGIQIGYHF